MDNHTVLVLSADLADPDLKLLAQLPPDTNIAVGNSVEAFERLAADATVILSWSASGKLLREVFAMCPKVRWVHSRAAGLDVRSTVSALAKAPQIPGRLEAVPAKRKFQVFVDYAHTDDALLNVVKTCRDLNPSRLILVFGCGGNRDRTKRPLMGAIADQYADPPPVLEQQLGSHQRPHPALFRRAIKPRRAVDAVAVDERHRRHVALSRGGDQILRERGAVEEGESGGGAELGVGAGGFCVVFAGGREHEC